MAQSADPGALTGALNFGACTRRRSDVALGAYRRPFAPARHDEPTRCSFLAYNARSYAAPVMRWGAKPSRSISQDLPDFHSLAGDCLNRFCGLVPRLAAPKRRPEPFVCNRSTCLSHADARSFFVSEI